MIKSKSFPWPPREMGNRSQCPTSGTFQRRPWKALFLWSLQLTRLDSRIPFAGKAAESSRNTSLIATDAQPRATATSRYLPTRWRQSGRTDALIDIVEVTGSTPVSPT